MKKISVAIDGPAGAGKSSVAKAVAKRAGYLYLDTGAMYRALTWAVLQANVDLADEKALKSLINTAEIHMEPGETDRVFVNGTDVTAPIRSTEVTAHVSAVAALPAVREKLVDLQRQIAARGGVILDGRDIGTIVLPKAELKVFLTASVEARAARRCAQLAEKGENVSLEKVKADIAARDKADSERRVSPLCEADDAVHVDNSRLTAEETADLLYKLIKEREI